MRPERSKRNDDRPYPAAMQNHNDISLAELYADLNATGLVRRLFELAREEDLGHDWEVGDITSRAFVPGYIRGRADVVFRNPGVVAGMAALDDLLFIFKADVDLTVHIQDGETATAGSVVASLDGDMRSILRAERTLLNLVSRMSGIATRTALFVQQAASQGGKAAVYDTRKTTPGLRVLEKYSVRCGGGMLHRIGLYDAAMIKDNHLASVRGLAGSDGPEGFVRDVKNAVRKANDEAPRAGLRFVELEVDAIEQLRAILDAGGCGVDVVLLDNMSASELRQAAALRDASSVGRRLSLEASGGVTLETIAEIAATGVDRVSTGSLTHQATWLDVGLDVMPGAR